jgi:hypothetical protein
MKISRIRICAFSLILTVTGLGNGTASTIVRLQRKL